jgi:phenylacetate-CoA ligase
MAALPRLVEQARGAPAMREGLQGVDAVAVTSRAALAQLPVTRKPELLERQKAQRATDPFGGYSTIGWRALRNLSGARRVYQSPGPIYEPEGLAADYWRIARALVAAGFEAGDLVHNSFSYHLTPGAWMMESGAQAIGCAVFPGGVGNTELQLQAMADLRPDAYCGTPSFLRILLEKAAEAGMALPSLKKALVSGEAFPPSLRDWLRDRGVEGYQAYATADVGLIAYETGAREGLVVDEGVLVEIVRPGTGDPVPEGEVGEVVVTVAHADYPLLRFGTGDLSAILPGPCPTGRSNVRIRGWMGRADQTAKVRGMFVHPSQVAEIVRRHAELVRARLVVSGEMANDRMTLRVEAATRPEGLADAVAHTVRDVTKLRADIELCAPGSLPNDGKVIEDARRYE